MSRDGSCHYWCDCPDPAVAAKATAVAWHLPLQAEGRARGGILLHLICVPSPGLCSPQWA